VKAFESYNGRWDEVKFRELIYLTGFKKKQLNKWFWDRKYKITQAIKLKKITYPGLLFQITDEKTGKDLTPSFQKITGSQPLFFVEKCKR
jgi:hypothetical protein